MKITQIAVLLSEPSEKLQLTSLLSFVYFWNDVLEKKYGLQTEEICLNFSKAVTISRVFVFFFCALGVVVVFCCFVVFSFCFFFPKQIACSIIPTCL